MAVHDESFWKKDYSGQISGELSPSAKRLRDEFVEEFLFDQSYINAAVRLGFHMPYASTYAKLFAEEPYVLQRIRQRQEEIDSARDLDKEKETLVHRVLTEAMQNGPYASRVAAAARMAAILGLDTPTKLEGSFTHRGGVMAVPTIASIEDWEKEAEASQGKLATETRA